MNTNSFVEVMKSRSNLELVEILTKRDDYQPEAIAVAESEMASRNLSSNEIHRLETLLAKNIEEKKNSNSFHDLVDTLSNDFQPSRVNAFSKDGFAKKSKKKKTAIEPLEEHWKVLLVLFPFIFGVNAVFNSVAYKDERSNEILKYRFYGIILYAILFVLLIFVVFLMSMNT